MPYKIENSFTNQIRASAHIYFFQIILNINWKTRSKMPTTVSRHAKQRISPTALSCHLQNCSAVRGRTQRATVQKNAARVTLFPGGISRSVHALPVTTLIWVHLYTIYRRHVTAGLYSTLRLNLLKPSGNFTYHQVQYSVILHSTQIACMYFVHISEQTATFTVNISNSLVFYNRSWKCLLRGTHGLYIKQITFRL
jgi:hypothetical protein